MLAFIKPFEILALMQHISAWTPPFFEVIRHTKHGEAEDQTIGPWQVRPTDAFKDGRLSGDPQVICDTWNEEVQELTKGAINEYIHAARTYWQLTRYTDLKTLQKMVQNGIKSRGCLFTQDNELSQADSQVFKINPEYVLYFHCEGKGQDAASISVKTTALEYANKLEHFVTEKLAVDIVMRDSTMQRVLSMLELP